jgi:hypothetical protein
MSGTSLHQFVARILADDRILFGDLKRLQRDILPSRITSREEAEILLFLDSAVRRADREWTVYLTTTVRDFAIWGLHPAGSLDRDKAEWISAVLSCADPTRTARVILREIVHEARTIDDDALLELGMGARTSPAKGSRVRQDSSLQARPRKAAAPGQSSALGHCWLA